ncbi:MAG: phosphopantetheine-binding protein [Candidatus Eremiobacteraeota bacterium]|nr:phosphopantetheine-binding protein [Candidatus Eremiobacteraeota bacterium]
MITVEKIRKDIRSYLSRLIRVSEIADDDDLFSTGLISSLFAMQLVLFVEKTYRIRIENEDLARRNFSSIRAVAELITRKLPEEPAQ